MTSPESRFEEVSRRAFTRRSFVAGALVLVPVLAACAKSDEDVFADTNATSTSPGGTPVTDAPTTVAAADTTVAHASVVETTASTAGPSEVPSGTPLPAGAEMTVDFTFAADDSGRRINNPYIAVWIENEAEALVQTISLWFNPPKGMRWLPDLKRWYSADQDRIDAGGADTAETISSATRVAGSYSVVWDGTDIDGVAVPAGTYYVCIEAAREHGPYELIREAVTLGSESFTAELAPDGELTAASVSFRV